MANNPAHTPRQQDAKSDREVVVRCTGVRKSYGDREILHGIDMVVHKGETLVIMGGSGSGKTRFWLKPNLPNFSLLITKRF